MNFLARIFKSTNHNEYLRFQKALEVTSSNLMMADENFNIVYVNKSVTDFLKEAEADLQKDLPNFRADDLVGKNIDIFHKRPEHQRSMLNSLTKSTRTSIQVGNRGFNLTAAPVFNEHGERRGTIVEWQDSAATGLVNAINRSQAVIEFTMDGNILTANENFLETMGYKLEDIVGKHHSMFVEPEYAASREYAAFWDKLRKGEHDAGEYLRQGRNGKNVWIQASYNPILDLNNRPVKVIKIASDITERKERDMIAERLKISMNSVTSNVMVADENNVITYINPAVHNMLKRAEADLRKQLPNFNSDNLIGQNIDVFHKNPKHQQDMLAALTGTYETTINVASRIFDLIAAPLFNDQNRRMGTVVEWKDVTVEKGIEKEIAQVVEGVAAGDFTTRLELEGKEGFLRTMSEGINRISDVSAKGLNEVLSVLQRLSDGDLTQKMDGDYQGTFQEIKDSLNLTIDKLFSIVQKIKEASQSVTSASGEISSGSVDLSSRTEQQASSLEETAASMEELTGTVRQNSENATEASKLANDARNVAENGGRVVNETVTAMNSIEKSSQKISDIIGVIDEIAFQTNLLALNAAVEAARAGEAGKGFAVVASEVRSLAGRSASASKEIKALIEESGQQVRSGAELANKAGSTLTEIVEAVHNVTSLVTEIADASREQATGIDEISSAVSQMDETTQQNAALVEENTAAAQSLLDQARELDRLMSFFQIGEDNEDFLDKVTPLHPKKEAAKPATSAKKNSKPSASTPKVATKSAVGSDYDNNWEEF